LILQESDMNHRSPTLHAHGVSITVATAAVIAAAIAGAIMTACSPPRAAARRIFAAPPAPTNAIDAEAAAARAVAVSHRVHAAELRLQAAATRVQAASLPPDPTIAIGLGIPIDGLGGSPVSISIMEGLAWLLAGEQAQHAAERERDAAAAELVAIAAEVAAEARRLVRSLDAARERHDALARSVAARNELVEIERAALEGGESTPNRVAALVAETSESRLELASAALEVHENDVAVRSLLALESEPLIASSCEVVPAATAPAPLSLEVLRARARVARAESALALGRVPLGADAAIGAGVNRDLEERESADATLEFTAPLFRRAQEQSALEDDLAAERAELAEAERAAAVELAHARARVADAQAQRVLALDALAAAEHARAAIERAIEFGESSRAELLRATAERDVWQARAAARRIAVADAIARIESRSVALNNDHDPKEGTR
jgi:hypothetical protein